MRELIGYCGLDCEQCDARIATVNNDEALREKTAKLWSRLNVAEITPQMINCVGCRIEGVKTPFCNDICLIRKCAESKGMETCGSCDRLDGCETVGAIISGNPQAMDNLKKKMLHI